MANNTELIENLIFQMRDGTNIDDAISEANVQIMLSDPEVSLTGEEAAKIACDVVYNLYDGLFPIDHLSPGDICIDAFRSNPCIITNINERSIHVMYFNGKTHKFKRNQERYFKKLDHSVFIPLQALLAIADRKSSTSYNEQILNYIKGGNYHELENKAEEHLRQDRGETREIRE